MKSLIFAFIFLLGSTSLAATYSYQGKFNGVRGVLTLVQANNTYTASFKGNNGQNGLLEGCNSTMGALLKYKEKNGKIRLMEFAFNRGQCFVEGRVVVLDFGDSSIRASLLSHHAWEQPLCYPDWQGHMHCPPKELVSYYFTGKFAL